MEISNCEVIFSIPSIVNNQIVMHDAKIKFVILHYFLDTISKI